MKANILGGQVFAYTIGTGFLVAGIVLTIKHRRLHPLLYVSLAAASFSWIEAPYDWATYAQFDPSLPRMPSWWPMNATWGGLPVSVPIGYIEYFVLPAFAAVAIERRLRARFHWRRPLGLLTVGLLTGYVWAFCFNGIFGARSGVFYYGRVIPGLAVFQGTKHQYPLYDALAMGIQMMVFTYLLGRTNAEGQGLIETWWSRRVASGLAAGAATVVSIVLLGNVLYGAVFAPHIITKLNGYVTAGPSAELFPGVPNQPLNGGAFGGPR